MACPLIHLAPGPTNRSAELATKPLFDDIPVPDPVIA
jgi:hypothetical protein